MVLEVSDNGESIQVYSGVHMRLRLIQLLGIAKTWRVASLVYGSVKPQIPAQERRTFLRYSGGLVAGLAVLGLKPMRATAQMILESPDSDTTASGRYLSGDELQAAVNEAVGETNYGLFRLHLVGQGYVEGRGQATGYQVDVTGTPSVLFVTVPYTNTQTGGIAQVKYTRDGSYVETVMGVFHSTNSTLDRIGVHEIVSGRVVHTRTFDFTNGTVTVREVSAPSLPEQILVELNTDTEVQIDKCHWCKKICKEIRRKGCIVGIALICPGLCVIFTGPGFPVCMALCSLMVIIICRRSTAGTCDWLCSDVAKVC